MVAGAPWSVEASSDSRSDGAPWFEGRLKMNLGMRRVKGASMDKTCRESSHERHTHTKQADFDQEEDVLCIESFKIVPRSLMSCMVT